MIVVGMGVNNQVTNSQDATCCWRVLGRQHAHWLVLLSGANLNTAVTLAHCVYDRLSWWKNLNVIDSIYNRETTESSFSTYPSDNISNCMAFYTEVVGTAMLLLDIYDHGPAQPSGQPCVRCVRLLPHERGVRHPSA
ncbi:hypothetical protein PR001_g17193 [Phytophthora rubi]|uniref:Uncharacterized protein n=1 Tax=Phytophthora rubi TaxID=129364 RepID=A0A6A3KSQ9_9STRA|nr:hypothetical protein PR001_g17193 [Phytophthora rubi]